MRGLAEFIVALTEAVDAFHQYGAIAARHADGEAPMAAVWSAYADYAITITRLAGYLEAIFFNVTLPITVAITAHPAP